MNMKRTYLLKRTAIASALTVVLVGGLATLSHVAATPQPVHAADGMQQPGPTSFSAVVKRVKPAVVNISTREQNHAMPGTRGRSLEMPEFPKGSPFDGLFKDYFNNHPGMSRGDVSKPESRSAGSGFIISADGYVVTNNHVVEHADKIEVIMQDGSRYQASIKGHDAKTDLALLKIDASNPLPFVEMGDSDTADVGDWVIAVGNPFGLGGTVTAGIISARGRDIKSGPFDDYLQIDAPINRGNSGGPLFDTQGRVVGINTAIYSPGGGNVGIGFAIPAKLAGDVIAQLKTDGSVARGWLGVQIQAITEAVAESLGLENQQGALVAAVTPGSPAQRGGLEPGDVILSMNGDTLEEMRDLPKLVARTKAGSKSVFEVQRRGERHKLEVTIGQIPNDGARIVASDPEEDLDSARIGIYLAELTPEAREQYDIPKDSDGVLITDVEKGSPAEKAGISAGSLINMVGQAQVGTPGEVVTRVKEAARNKRPSVLLLLEKSGEKRFIAVKFAAA